MSAPIRVLIVDDSAFARKVLREVLAREPGIEVIGIARDGLEALEKIAEMHPDVVTLDLMMPDLDGLGVLRALPKLDAPRVIVVSNSGRDSDLALEALQAGATDLVAKPTPLPTERMYQLAEELVRKVRTAAQARPRPRVLLPEPAAIALPGDRPTGLVVIGTSTGGPQALTDLFGALPADLTVPIAVALHIPAGYTAPLAERLSRSSRVPVAEATQGMRLRPGQAILAPGGMHLSICFDDAGLFAHVSLEPLGLLHRPSVDVLFESAARCTGSATVGVVLTGMGDDGTRGARAIRDAGGRVLAEAASSCVVYGMPRSAKEAGVVDAMAPLSQMADLIAAICRRSPTIAPSRAITT